MHGSERPRRPRAEGIDRLAHGFGLSCFRAANDHEEARSVAQAAITLAERTDGLVDTATPVLHWQRCWAPPETPRGASRRRARSQPVRCGKVLRRLPEKARRVLGERPAPVAPREAPSVELTNACVEVANKLIAAVHREAWDEVVQLFAPYVP